MGKNSDETEAAPICDLCEHALQHLHICVRLFGPPAVALAVGGGPTGALGEFVARSLSGTRYSDEGDTRRETKTNGKLVRPLLR